MHVHTLKTNIQSPYTTRFMNVRYTVRTFYHPVHQTSFRVIFVHQFQNLTTAIIDQNVKEELKGTMPSQLAQFKMTKYTLQREQNQTALFSSDQR